MPPQCGTHIIKRTINNLKWSQRRGARYVSNCFGNHSSVDNMLATLEWKSLQAKRKDARLGMLYKIVNDKVKGDRLVPPLRSTRNMHQLSFQIPSSRSDYRTFSYFSRTIRDWNSLPPDIVSAKTLDAFKAQVSGLPH